jgi:hypothetical protein
MRRFHDITGTTAEVGLDCQVKVSAEVWDRCIRWADEDSRKQDFQEEDARLWDMAFVGAMRLKRGYTEEMLRPPGGIRYEIYVLLRDGHSKTAVPTNLRITRKGLGLIISFADETL